MVKALCNVHLQCTPYCSPGLQHTVQAHSISYNTSFSTSIVIIIIIIITHVEYHMDPLYVCGTLCSVSVSALLARGTLSQCPDLMQGILYRTVPVYQVAFHQFLPHLPGATPLSFAINLAGDFWLYLYSVSCTGHGRTTLDTCIWALCEDQKGPTSIGDSPN